MYAASGKCARTSVAPIARAPSSAKRGRKRLPPASSIRRTASVISALSVENELRKKSSTSPCRSRLGSRCARAFMRPRHGRAIAPPPKPHVAHVAEARAAKALGQLVGVGIVGQRVRQIAIGRLRAADEAADQRHEPVEIQVEQPPEERVRRFATRRGSRTARRAAARAAPRARSATMSTTLRIEKPIVAPSKRGVGERQLHARRLDERGRARCGPRAPRAAAHRRASARRSRSPVTSQRRIGAHEMERQIARPAAQVEDRAAMRRPRAPRRHACASPHPRPR